MYWIHLEECKEAPCCVRPNVGEYSGKIKHRWRRNAETHGKDNGSSQNHWPDIYLKRSRSKCTNTKCTALTNVYCVTCATFLCFTSKRNCFAEFHQTKFPSKHQHLPVYLEKTSRSRCQFGCSMPSNLTNVFCSECNVCLCFNHSRNCFVSYHMI